MNLAYLNSNDFSFFSDAQEQLDMLIEQLKSEHRAESEHGDIENFINKEGHEIMRRLLQGWLDLKADKEEKKDRVTSASGEPLNHVRVDTTRALESLFGKVTVTRISLVRSKKQVYSQLMLNSTYPLIVTVMVFITGYAMRPSEALLMMLLKQSHQQQEVTFQRGRASI